MSRTIASLCTLLFCLLLLGNASPDLLARQSPSDRTTVATDPALSPKMIAVRDKVRRCLDYYYNHPLNTRDHSTWEVMHMAMAFGVDAPVRSGGPGGPIMNAIGWICWNYPCSTGSMLTISDGRPAPIYDTGLQGHEGQFLMLLAMSRVKPDFPIKVAGRNFTVADLVEYEKGNCRGNSELSFQLVGLVHYLKSDAVWSDRYGTRWDFPRMIREELAQPVIGSTCGGSHRMMGFSYAVHTRQSRGEPVTGQWLRAKKYVDDYIDYTFKLQNENGSLSSEWFRGRGDWGGPGDRMESTGHVLEWLVFSMPEDHLQDERLVRAVTYLADLMIRNRQTPWSSYWGIGPAGHALHGLVLYDQRVFGAKPGKRWRAMMKAAEPKRKLVEKPGGQRGTDGDGQSGRG